MPEPTPVADLVALVDRLETLLERSGLSELELEVAGTTVILRTPAAVAPASAVGQGGTPGSGQGEGVAAGPPARARGSHTVVAPLTGVFYRAPSPGAEPYVRDGSPVSTGQVIGLIEAMKLFNEIKSDVTGVVRHVAAADGDLVKARQPLLEVDPA